MSLCGLHCQSAERRTQAFDPSPGSSSPPASQFWNNYLFNRVMGDHVARRAFVDFKTERSAPNVSQRLLHTLFIFPHSIGVWQSRALFIMLGLPEATVIVSKQNLHLFSPAC